MEISDCWIAYIFEVTSTIGTCSGDSGGPLTLFNTLEIVLEWICMIISAVKEYLNEFHKIICWFVYSLILDKNIWLIGINCTLYIFIVHT